MKSWRNLFNSQFYFYSKPLKTLFLLLFLSQLVIAQVEENKTIKDTYDGKEYVSLVHAHGPMLVKKSPDKKVYIEAEIYVKARDRKDVDIVLDHFEIDAGGLGNRLELTTAFKTQSWNTTNNSTTIKFKDGQKAKGIKDLIMTATLLIPNLDKLELKNKYGDINIDTELSGDLSVTLFSGKLETNGSCEDIDLTMKYSKGYLQNAVDAKIELFDSDLIMGNLSSAEVNSKYSEVELGNNSGNLNIQSFDDKWKAGRVTGDFKFNGKYSEFEFETLSKAEGSNFDGEIKANSIDKLTLKSSKYSKYKIDELGELIGYAIFDDDYEIGNVESIEVSDSKYSSYKIEGLKDAFTSENAFDDNIRIDEISTNFEKIYMQGKYTKMDFHIETNAQFEVDVDLQHGKIEHPDFDVRIHKEVHNKIELQGHVGPEKSNNPKKLTIKGFDNTIYWK